MDVIDSFKKDYRFLSNFHVDEIHIISVEHKYQAAKATNIKDYQKIMRCPLPRDAKRESKTIAMRPDWNDIRLTIMEQCLIEKFSLAHLAIRLLETEDAHLIEGNTWHDCFWGVCQCDRCGNQGKNHLGRLLMKTRDQFLQLDNMVQY